MLDIVKKHLSKAKKILGENWTGTYTLPSGALYPHQWNWDSGFIAIGYSHYDTKRAIREISSLFDAQWANGMIPQIVFNRKKLGQYFPEPDFWKTELSPHAPANHLTSGITMPPIHAVSVLRIYENAHNPQDVMPFLRLIYPKLLESHRFLYRERNYNESGLIYIRHPWESGMDNAPSWDAVMEGLDFSAIKLPDYKRKDTESSVSAEMRPTKEYYDYFVYLLELFKMARYDEKTIAEDCPFMVCGPLFNAILCASNEALIKLSEILHEPYKEIEEWYSLTAGSVRDKLYNSERGIFDALNIHANALINLDTAAGFTPLFGGAASSTQAARIYEYLNSKSFCALHQGNCFTIPSYDTQKPDFRRENYWRGPVWININWMLMQGLRRYGFHQRADSLARNIMELPMRFGFYEYFDSLDGRGYGSENFSWSAALYIDTVYETYIKIGAGGAAMKRAIMLKEMVINGREKPGDITGIEISQEMLKAIRNIKAEYYTAEGNVDYESIKHSDSYKEYKVIAASLRNFDPALLITENERLAFWINLYNTIVVDGIIETGVKESIREAVGFFSKVKYDVGGYHFSPDDIEHGILRANSRKHGHVFRHFGIGSEKKKFALHRVDPRVHFALVCGSRSCAPIRYYTAEGIDEELELAAQNFINSSEVILSPEENRVSVSEMFKWYEIDFGGHEGVLGFIEKYILDDDKKEFLAKSAGRIDVEYLYYDWNLNK
ncbi:MAG: DUF547 domain-containing protein [Nitrospira sp.]|nr:DUF547 domain-containing protein [bacterium]MBL7049798.1 DUF547 domain-containing protein [Nitrospira sp.]